MADEQTGSRFISQFKRERERLQKLAKPTAQDFIGGLLEAQQTGRAPRAVTEERSQGRVKQELGIDEAILKRLESEQGFGLRERGRQVEEGNLAVRGAEFQLERGKLLEAIRTDQSPVSIRLNDLISNGQVTPEQGMQATQAFAQLLDNMGLDEDELPVSRAQQLFSEALSSVPSLRGTKLIKTTRQQTQEVSDFTGIEEDVPAAAAQPGTLEAATGLLDPLLGKIEGIPIISSIFRGLGIKGDAQRQARGTLDLFMKDIVRAISLNERFPIAEQKQIQSISPKVGTFSTERGAISDFTAFRGGLQEVLDRNKASASNPKFSKKVREEAQEVISQLPGIINKIDSLLAGSSAGVVVDGEPRFIGAMTADDIADLFGRVQAGEIDLTPDQMQFLGEQEERLERGK